MEAPGPDTGRSPPAGIDPEDLEPEDFRSLAYASALGTEFDFDLLAESLESETERLSERIERMIARGALRERPGGDRFAFADETFRARIYQSLTESRLRVIHGRIAQAMERRNPDPAPEVVVELGRHYFLGRRPEKAWGYNRRAGQQARRGHHLETAVHHLERARRDLRSLPGEHTAELAQIDEELGDLQRSLGRLEASEISYLHALQGTPPADAPVRARILLALAHLALSSGQPARTLQLCDEAFGLAQGAGDLKGQAEAHRIRGRLAAQTGEYATQLDEAMIALDLLQRVDDRGALGECCTDIAIAFTNLGPEVSEDGKLWFRRAVEILSGAGDELGTVRALANLAVSVGRTDPLQALDYLRQARERAERISAPPWILRTLLLGTEHHLALGQPEEAERDHRQAVRLLERVGEPQARVGVALSRGMIAEKRGAWEDAEQAFREADDLARAQSLLSESAEAKFRLARLYYKTRDLAAAREAYRAAGRQDLTKLLPPLAPAYAELGRLLEVDDPRPAAGTAPDAAGGGYKNPRAPP